MIVDCFIMQNLAPHSPASKPRLVLFDLDHTLLPIDSDQTWGEFLHEEGLVSNDHKKINQAFYEDYARGELDVHAYLRFVFQIFAQYDRAQLKIWQQQYFEKKIAHHICAQACALLRRHQADTCLLVTATNSFVVQPIAQALGFEMTHLVATEPATLDLHSAWYENDDPFSGGLRGVPCFRENKIKKIEEWLGQNHKKREDFQEVWSYSDSRNDIPMLTWADKAVATNPDAVLLAHAHAHTWPVMHLFF